MAAITFQTLGCASSREYQCPEPIGLIIRDDCDTYQTRYDTLRVDLGAGIGPAKLETSIRKEAMRDPSELVQVMGARMTALCHDFNACRVTQADYLRRRREIDQTMTAIMALGEQLKRPDLTRPERQQLLEKLMRLLGEPAPREKTAEPNSKPEQDRKTRVRKKPYFGSLPWFGSVHLPPVAPPVKEGFPRLIHPWGKPRIGVVWVPKTKAKPNVKKIGGWAPSTGVKLWGRVEADDQIEIRMHDGTKQRCPVKVNKKGVVGVRCPLPKEYHLTGNSYGYEIGYYRAALDQWATLGSVERQVLHGVENNFNVDHDQECRQGWLMFIPEPRLIPPDFERPQLHVTVSRREKLKATARCWVGDQAVTPALRAARDSGQTATLQDRPRYIGGKSVKKAFVGWWHYAFPMPFVVSRAKGTPPEGMTAWPPKTGAWRCRVSLDGVPVRELRFTINDDGKPEPMKGQEGKPGDIVHPWWRVETKILPNEIEAVIETQRVGS